MKKGSEQEELIEHTFGRRAIPRRVVRAKLEELEFSRTGGMREILSSLPTVRLEVAEVLSTEGEARLARRLEEYLSEPAQFEVVVNSAIVGGAVISFKGRRFDGSWAKKLEDVKYDQKF